MEIWKDIKNYEGYYQVSNNGKVKSLPRKILTNKGELRNIKGRILKQAYQGSGYLAVGLTKKNNHKSILVHRLVLIAFVNNLENKPCGNHKDCNKTNNIISNLEWVTYSENRIHAIKNNLITFVTFTNEQKADISKRFSDYWKKNKKSKSHLKNCALAHKGYFPQIAKDRMIKIKCVETGLVFESIRQAARDMNLCHGTIWRNISGLKSRMNYTFIKI